MSAGNRRARVGTCSVCRCALEASPNGAPVPRTKALRQRGHRHRQEWRVVPDIDEPDHGVRGWMVAGGRYV